MVDDGYQAPAGYMTLGEVREHLGVSKTTLAKRVRDGLLPTYQDPRDTRVKLAKVEDVERLTQPVPTPHP
jgi:excisionase family DNA binding protein